MVSKGFKGLLLCLWNLLFLSACSHTDRRQVDELNSFSYACHYRNLDSAEAYARKAYAMSARYGVGRAEAVNNMAFVCIARMDYAEAKKLLDGVESYTDNQVELLVSDVQQMRLCQRMSRNKEFYDYCERAAGRLKRINEERAVLPPRLYRRLVYAESEFSIVNSTYYYYVGLERSSAEALQRIDPDGEIRRDTAQYLSYLYNVGSGGIVTGGTQTEVVRKEFESLMKCYLLSVQYGYTFFEANTLEAMSELLMSRELREQLLSDNALAVKYVRPDTVGDDMVAGWMAGRALQLFREYGDVYQIAGAHRTLATSFMESGDYMPALEQLGKALENKKIHQAPDLVASIREQLSVAYSAVNDKPSSDYNRNIYLELQEETRQDRYFESRAEMLDKSSAQLNVMIVAVITAIFLLVFLLCFFFYLNRKRRRKWPMDRLLKPLREWQETNDMQTSRFEERMEDMHEALALRQMRVRDGERRCLDNRAKVSLAGSVIPLIDRIINEVRLLSSRNEDSQKRSERYVYIAELAGKIDEYNNVLTHWIQLHNGRIDLHIESFPLQPLFDIVARSRTGFVMSCLQLDVRATTVWVKADRVLTLFMINTLADNARKFTPRGGRVAISAAEGDGYVEISVEDTGCGMSAGQLQDIFNNKVYNGHGFGLMNCRGIMEKYRKISSIFSVCKLSAESKPGCGSRFFFRLPRGVARALAVLLLSVTASAGVSGKVEDGNLSRAKMYADSAYFSNIDGTYEKTMLFADSCLNYLNRHYLSLHPAGTCLMRPEGDLSVVLPEIKWFQDSLPTNYNIILDIRNESAVAALALHRWHRYAYNNRAYTQLFKEMSADSTLAGYCRTMQQSQTNKTIAVIMLVIVFIAILPAYYLLYYRHRLYYRFCVERVRAVNDILLDNTDPAEKLKRMEPLVHDQYPAELQEIVDRIVRALHDDISSRRDRSANIELAEDECRKTEYEYNNLHVTNSVLDNCLSTLKHETMYYPGRINRLVHEADIGLDAMTELVTYYRDIYTMLCRQAVRQAGRVKIALAPVPAGSIVAGADEGLRVLGNRNLLEYLFEILGRQNGHRPLAVTVEPKDDRYLLFTVLMTGLRHDARTAALLFAPSADNIPYLLCRQIVRDHSEAAARRGCGIQAAAGDGGTTVRIVLPRHI